MEKSELQWVVKIPTPSCPKCGKEGVETVAWLVNRDEIACGFCASLIDLTSEDWRAYLKDAIDALGKLRTAYSKIP
jgi:hypothetical protein